jgi:hypothetical protein
MVSSLLPATRCAHQLPSAVIVVFLICAAEFLVRYNIDRPVHRKSSQESNDGTSEKPKDLLDRRTKAMIIAIAFNTTCLFIRCVCAIAGNR